MFCRMFLVDETGVACNKEQGFTKIEKCKREGMFFSISKYFVFYVCKVQPMKLYAHSGGATGVNGGD